jgi:hypothetical protein
MLKLVFNHISIYIFVFKAKKEPATTPKKEPVKKAATKRPKPTVRINSLKAGVKLFFMLFIG